MGLYRDAFLKLRESIISNDLLILFAGVLALVLFALSWVLSGVLKKEIKNYQDDKSKEFRSFSYKLTRFFYTLFVTIISIFPLLGMLGTVVGLLGLDMSSGNMENIKVNFFIALTSTAWGIIFSVVYKIAHALIADNVEEQIGKAKELIDK